MSAFLNLIAIAMLLSEGARAQSPALTLAESYLRETKKVLQLLKHYEIKDIACRSSLSKDCLTPDDLLAALEKGRIQFIESKNFSKPARATRWTAFYESATGKVYLNAAVPHYKELQGFVGLHETLGASGRPETEYYISKAVMALAKIHDGTFSRLSPEEKISAIKSLRHHIAESPQNKRAHEIDHPNSRLLWAGGGTAVGGGGDGLSIAQRMLFARFMMESWARASGFLPVHFLKMDIAIEVIDSPSPKIDYVMPPREHIGWPVKILVPRYMTQQKPVRDLGAPNRALEDIALYFGSLRPGLFPQITFPRMYYQNKRKQNVSYPTSFSMVHPEAIKNFYQIQYAKLCAEGCIYLGTR